MKRILPLLAIAAISFTGCKKEDHGDVKQVSLDISLSKTSTYTLNLNQYGDADDLSTIVTQAGSYVKSEIIRPSGSRGFNDVYTYIPDVNIKVNETKTDKVVLKVYEPQDRGHCNHDETDITINFKISN